jgi:hypothetical protein
MKSFFSAILSITLMAAISGCSSEIGSEAWCTMLTEKPKAEWSTNDLKNYAAHCVFK